MILAQSVGLTDIIVVLCYLAAVGYLGWLGYRRTKTAADYLVAGRKTHPFIMAMSYGATFISTSAIVGFGGVAAGFGMSLLWLTFLNIFVGIFIAFVLLGGPARHMGHRLDAHTFPELLGRRYDSKFIQVLAGLIIFLFMPLYASAVLIGGSEFVAQQFGLSYQAALLIFSIITAVYVVMGGLKGVMYTDALQGSIMFVGMFILLVWTYVMLGGVTQAHQDLTALAPQAFAGFKALGHQGWTAMPKFGFGWGGIDPASGKPSPYDLWWIVVSTIVLGVGIGVLAQPQLIVRFMTVKSKKELNRAVVTGGVFIIVMTGVAFTVGALSNVYFSKYEVVRGKLTGTETVPVIAKKTKSVEVPAMCVLLHVDTDGDGEADTHVVKAGVDVTAPNGKVTPWSKLMPQAQVTELSDGTVEVRPNTSSFLRAVVWSKDAGKYMFNVDSIIPIYVTSALPKWFGLLFLLTLLSAAMSTLSSQFHTLGTGLGRDVCEQLLTRGRSAAGARTTYIVRIGIIIGIIIAVVLSSKIRGGYIVARSTAIFFGLCASAFLPAFVGGLFFSGMTRPAAIASMVVGFTVTAFWLLFVKAAEAEAIGLVQLVTDGKSSILQNCPNWPVVDPMVVALPLSALTAVVVSLFTSPPSADHLDKCFASTGKP